MIKAQYFLSFGNELPMAGGTLTSLRGNRTSDRFWYLCNGGYEDMEKTIDVEFPGGKRVDVRIGGVVIHTDQTLENGGQGSAPEPFQLFLASIAACAGIYALEFCQARELSIQGMALTMSCEWDEKKHAIEKMHIDLKLPPGFPDRYKKAAVRVMDLCSVKKHIIHAPEFVITAD